MPLDTQASGNGQLNPTSKISFTVAGCAFSAAAIGYLINQWMSGWMAVGGMAGVGLFCLALGLLNLNSNALIFEEDAELVETASHRLSGATNVDDLLVSHAEESTVGSRRENLASSNK